MKHNDGTLFESYVEWVQSRLLEMDGENVQISRRTKLRTAMGSDTPEFDIFYSFEKGGVEHKVVIEVKDNQRPIEAADVRNFGAKMQMVTGLNATMISRNGYQQGCYEVAQHFGIKLLAGNDLPNLMQIIGLQVKSINPTIETKADPFYAIMFAADNSFSKSTGEYFVIDINSKHIVPLFISRVQAERYKHILDEKARRRNETPTNIVCGLTQGMLAFAILVSDHSQIGENTAIKPFHLAVLLQAPNDSNLTVVVYDGKTCWSDFVRDRGNFEQHRSANI